MVRREGRPRQELSPEYERLARGEDDRLRPRPQRPRIRDERAVALVPGVANRDARAVFEAHLEGLQEARRGHPDDPAATEQLAEALRDVVRARLWRGRSLTGFDVLVEQVLDLPAQEARALVGDIQPFTDEATAIWLRAEAALLEHGIAARVRIVRDNGEERLVVEAPVARAPRTIEALARRLGQLARDLG